MVVYNIYFYHSLSCFLVYFFKKNKCKNKWILKFNLLRKKTNSRDELDDLIDEHDNLLEEYSGLGDQLQVQDSIIKQQILTSEVY